MRVVECGGTVEEAIPRNMPARLSLYLGLVPPFLGLLVLVGFLLLDRDSFGVVMFAFAAGGGPCFLVLVPGFGLHQGIKGWRLAGELADLGGPLSTVGIVLNMADLVAFVVWVVLAVV